MGYLVGVLSSLNWSDIEALWPKYRTGFHLGKPIAVGLYCATALLGLLLLASRFIGLRKSISWAWKSIRAVLWLGIVILLFQALVATLSRGAWLAAVVVLPIAVMIRYGKSLQLQGVSFARKVLLGIICVISLTALTVMNLDKIKQRSLAEWDTIDTLWQDNIDNLPTSNISIRLWLWDFAIDKASQRLWLGWGPASSERWIVSSGREKLARRYDDNRVYYDHLHNTFFELWLAFGLIGMVPGLSLISLLLLRLFKMARAQRIPFDYTLFLAATLVMAAIWAVFDYRLIHWDWRSFWLLFAGAIYTLCLTDRGDASRPLGMSKQHIAILLSNFGHGGVERMLVNLARGFNELGCRVDFLIRDREVPFVSSLHRQVNLIELSASSHAQLLQRLVSYLNEFQPQILMAAKIKDEELALQAKSKLGNSPDVFLRIGTNVTARLATRRRNPIKRWLINRAFRERCRKADGLIAVSQGVADDMMAITQLSSDRIHVLRNPVVTPDLAQRAAESVDHPWLQNGQPPVLIGAGGLRQQKNFLLLLQAFAKVRAQRPCRLLILGEGRQRQRLQSLARELGVDSDFELPGFIENAYAYMAKAALFVLSSNWEGSPNVVAEALAVGTPVVSTDCPSGAREILQNGRFGKLVPMNDEQALTTAILASLDETPDPDFLRQGAQPYTLESSSKAYLKAFWFALMARAWKPDLAVLLATSGHSGVDKVMKKLIPALADRGLAVDVLQINNHGPYWDKIPDAVRLVPLGTDHVNTSLWALIKYLRRCRPRALLSDKDKVNRLCLLARRLARVSTRVAVRMGTTVSKNLQQRSWLDRCIQYGFYSSLLFRR